MCVLKVIELGYGISLFGLSSLGPVICLGPLYCVRRVMSDRVSAIQLNYSFSRFFTSRVRKK